MRTKVFSISCVFLTLLLTGCASKLIAYQPAAKMSIKESASLVEELTMRQPQDVRPDKIEIHENHIYWNYGYYTVQYNNGGFGSRAAYLRASFKEVRNTEIYLKREWYCVYLIDNGGDSYPVYYTQDLNDAKQYSDAYESLRLGRNNISNENNRHVEPNTKSTPQ